MIAFCIVVVVSIGIGLLMEHKLKPKQEQERQLDFEKESARIKQLEAIRKDIESLEHLVSDLTIRDGQSMMAIDMSWTSNNGKEHKYIMYCGSDSDMLQTAKAELQLMRRLLSSLLYDEK